MADYRLISKTPTSPAQVYTADASGDLIASASHGMLVDYAVKFATTGGCPGGITAGTEYYVVAVPDDGHFQISATRRGSVLNITSAGTGTNTFVRNVWLIYKNTTGEQIPDDLSRQPWIDYLTWEAMPNTIDPATTPVLSAYKANAQSNLAAQAATERAKWIPLGSDFWWGQRIAEARAVIAVGGTISIGDDPLVECEVGINGGTPLLVANAIMAEWSTIEAGLAAIAPVERTAFYAINAAANTAAVDAALAAIVWP